MLIIVTASQAGQTHQNPLLWIYINVYLLQIGILMNIQISRWGNSLAMRIPAEVIKQIHIKEGDRVEATLSLDGTLIIKPQKLDRKTLAKMAKEQRDPMKMGKSVMDEVRSEARY
jgi:antitoxin MazE